MAHMVPGLKWKERESLLGGRDLEVEQVNVEEEGRESPSRGCSACPDPARPRAMPLSWRKGHTGRQQCEEAASTSKSQG